MRSQRRLAVMLISLSGTLLCGCAGGVALGDYTLAGIDPKLADTYRQTYLAETEPYRAEPADLQNADYVAGVDYAAMRPVPADFDPDTLARQ